MKRAKNAIILRLFSSLWEALFNASLFCRFISRRRPHESAGTIRISLAGTSLSACFIPAKPRSFQRHVCRGVQAEIGKVPRAVLKIPFRRNHGGVVCTEFFVGNHGLYARRRAPLRKKAAQIAVRRDAAARDDGIQPAFLRRFDGFFDEHVQRGMLKGTRDVRPAPIFPALLSGMDVVDDGRSSARCTRRRIPSPLSAFWEAARRFVPPARGASTAGPPG